MSTERTSPGPPAVPPVLEKIVDHSVGVDDFRGALDRHREHLAAWYAPLIGSLLLPASEAVAGRLPGPESAPVDIGLVADAGLESLPAAIRKVPPGLRLTRVDAQVAKRAQDPGPGVRRLLALSTDFPTIEVYAEIPLTWGLLESLDTIADARADGARIAPKFRTGGLAAELFPTPVELAAVICACRERELPFTLTAGLRHAVRHNDPETGLTHHGFLNVLSATLTAVAGAELVEVAERLGSTDPVPLIEDARRHRTGRRPLWMSFGACGVTAPLADLRRLGLVTHPG